MCAGDRGHGGGRGLAGDERVAEQHEDRLRLVREKGRALQDGVAEAFLLRLESPTDAGGKRGIAVEVAADDFLFGRDDDYDLVRAGRERLLDDEVDGWLRADREHFLRHDARDGQEARTVSCRWNKGFHADSIAKRVREENARATVPIFNASPASAVLAKEGCVTAFCCA